MAPYIMRFPRLPVYHVTNIFVAVLPSIDDNQSLNPSRTVVFSFL
jgi:hypothetical protein